MGQHVLVLIEQMKVFGVLMLIGFVAQKVKALNDENIDNVSAILCRVIMPLMIVTSVGNGDKSQILGMGNFFLAVFIAYCISFALAFLSGRVMKLQQPTRDVHVAVSTYSNSGFFAAPISISMFGTTGAIAFAAYSIIDCPFVWTLGPALLDPNTSGIKFDWRKLVNPVSIAIVAGLIIIFSGLKQQGNLVWETLTSVGATSKYFACIYIGADVGRKGIKFLFLRPKVLGAVFTKLIIYPITAIFVINWLGLISDELLTILIIYCSAPTMVVVAVLSRLAGSDDEYASAGVVISSILCLFTMPFVMWVMANLI